MATVQAARSWLYGQILADWPTADRETLAALLARLNDALTAHVRNR